MRRLDLGRGEPGQGGSFGSTLIGASKVSQLDSNIAATGIHFEDAHFARLNEASAPLMGFSAALASPMIRRMVYGGHEVVGWDD